MWGRARPRLARPGEGTARRCPARRRRRPSASNATSTASAGRRNGQEKALRSASAARVSAAYGVAIISRREGTHARASVGKGVQVLVRAPGRRADSTAAAVRCGRRGQFARPHAHLACGAFERRRRPQKGQSRRQWEGLSSTGVRTTVPQAVRGKRGGEEGGTSARADSESRGHVWPYGVTSNAPSSPPVKRRGRHVRKLRESTRLPTGDAHASTLRAGWSNKVVCLDV